MPLLKKLFWLYFLLLIFEGALRKWIVPQLSAPLLLVRDPVGMLIIWEAYRTHKWPKQWSVVTAILTVGLAGLCVMQTVVVDNPWFAALYGLRSYLLPFPVAFIMGENLDEEDLHKFGICTLWLLLPLTALEVAQYLAPASSWLNAGAYAGAGQINYVGAHVRASATFSFVAGSVAFGCLAAAFIFYGLVNERFAKKWLLWAASFALILSIPVIGARELVFELLAVIVCVVIGALFGVSQFAKSLRIILPVLAVALLVSLLPVFSEASNSLTERFTQASASEGGSVQQSFMDRTINEFTGRFGETDFMSNPLGIGMGIGAAATSTLLTGAPEFLAGEDEFGRNVIELGPFPGVAYMLFRVLLAIFILSMALSRARDHQPLALLLVPGVFATLLFAILEQPTLQGFMVISVAFSLAAIRVAGKAVEPALLMNPRWRPVHSSLRSLNRTNRY